MYLSMGWASSTEGMGASGAGCAVRPHLRGPMLHRQRSSAQRLSRESPRMHWNLSIHTDTHGGAGLGGCQLRREYSAWTSLEERIL